MKTVKNAILIIFIMLILQNNEIFSVKPIFSKNKNGLREDLIQLNQALHDLSKVALTATIKRAEIALKDLNMNIDKNLLQNSTPLRNFLLHAKPKLYVGDIKNRELINFNFNNAIENIKEQIQIARDIIATEEPVKTESKKLTTLQKKVFQELQQTTKWPEGINEIIASYTEKAFFPQETMKKATMDLTRSMVLNPKILKSEVQKALDEGATWKIPDTDFRFSPFGLAITNGLYDIVELLIEEGANVNEFTFDRSDPIKEKIFTPLILAIRRLRDLDIYISPYMVLRTPKEEVDKKNEKRNQMIRIIKLLLKNKANPNVIISTDNVTGDQISLLIDVTMNHPDLEIFRILLENNADINLGTYNGKKLTFFLNQIGLENFKKVYEEVNKSKK